MLRFRCSEVLFGIFAAVSLPRLIGPAPRCSSMSSSTSCGLMSTVSYPVAVAGLVPNPFDVIGFVDLGAKVLSKSELELLKHKIDGIYPPPAASDGGMPLGLPTGALGPIRKPRRNLDPIPAPIFGPAQLSVLATIWCEEGFPSHYLLCIIS